MAKIVASLFSSCYFLWSVIRLQGGRGRKEFESGKKRHGSDLRRQLEGLPEPQYSYEINVPDMPKETNDSGGKVSHVSRCLHISPLFKLFLNSRICSRCCRLRRKTEGRPSVG